MKLPVTIDPRYHDAVIFDLDGVLTDTACSDARRAHRVGTDGGAGAKISGRRRRNGGCSSSSTVSKC